MTKRSDKQLKRKKNKLAHEMYLKRLFARYGHGLVLNSNREAPGNKYYDSIQVLKEAK